MKHAIACKLDGQHGVLAHASRIEVVERLDLAITVYRDGHARILPGSMPVLFTIFCRPDGQHAATSIFSRS